MTKFENLYKILEISDFSDINTIKQAYRNLTRKFHPDNFANASDKEKKQSEMVQQKLNDAWQVLSDEKRKQDYDSELKYHLDCKKYSNAFSRFSKQESSFQDIAKDFQDIKREFQESYNYTSFASQDVNDYFRDVTNRFKTEKIRDTIRTLERTRFDIKQKIEKRRQEIRIDSLNSNEYVSLINEIRSLTKEINELTKKEYNLNNQISKLHSNIIEKRNNKLNQILFNSNSENQIKNILSSLEPLQQELIEVQNDKQNKIKKQSELKDKMSSFPPEEYYRKDKLLNDLYNMLESVDMQIDSYNNDMDEYEYSRGRTI